MKKVISLILAFSMITGYTFQNSYIKENNFNVACAIDESCISIKNVSAKPGETVDVDIEIINNPGIIALSFDVNYDNKKLQLINVTDRKILGDSTFTVADKNAVPCRIFWDDFSTENHTNNGTVATLTFKILDNAEGTADVGIKIDKSSTFNADMGEVSFDVKNGKIDIITETTTTTTTSTTTTTKPTTTTSIITTTQPITTTTNSTTTSSSLKDKSNILIGDISGKPGETVDVDIEIINNPGIIALSLAVDYDNKKLQLVNVTDRKILGDSTFTVADKNAVPCKIFWDDFSTENHTNNGTVATLTFKILDNAEGTADIGIKIDKSSTFNADMEEVSFDVKNGKIDIITETNSTTTTSTTTTTKPTTTTTSTTTTTKPTTTTTTSTTTMTKPTTTSTSTITTTQPITTTTNSTTTSSSLKDKSSILVGDVSGKPGETVDVDIEIINNPGIIALSLAVDYDNKKLQLVNVTDRKILGDSTFTVADKNAIPCIIFWDDFSTENHTNNGTVATLTFKILDNTEGTADVGIKIDKSSTFNADMEEVSFDVKNGKIDIITETNSTTTTTSATTTTTTSTTTTTTTSTTTTTKPTTTTTTSTTTTTKPTTTTTTSTTTTTKPTTTTTTSTTTTTKPTTTTTTTTTTKPTTTTTTSTTTTTKPTTTTTTSTTTTTDTNKAVPGDMNGDGKVEISDAVILYRYIAGGWDIELDESVADVDNDGIINIKDFVFLRRYIAGGWNVTLE